MDRGAWQAIAHGVEESQTRLSMHTVINIQWLRLHTFTPGAWVQSLVRELRSHKPHSAEKKKIKLIHLINIHYSSTMCQVQT